MQIFWSQMGVPLEHLPIFVSCYERGLLDREPRLEEATGRFVPEVVEFEVPDAQLLACATERGPHRAAVVGEDKAAASGERPLLLENGPGIESGDIQQWYFLVIAVLVSWVFSVTHDHGTSPGIDVLPANAADLVLAHCGGNCETHDSSERNDLPLISGEIVGKALATRRG